MRNPDPCAPRVERLMEHLEGCVWHQWVRRQRLLVIWRAQRDAKGAPGQEMETVLRVVNLDDAEEVGVWPIHPSPEGSASGQVTPEDAVATARARIDRGFV